MQKSHKNIYVFLLMFVIFFIESNLLINSNGVISSLVSFEKTENFGIITEDLLAQDSGIASYYADKFHKKKTASGELYDIYGYTAAHKKLPFGTIVKVTNSRNSRSTLVKINDRGPFVRGRIIDLSHRAAKSIDGLGIPKVSIDYFSQDEVIEQLDSTFYLGYSINEPLLITKKANISIVEEADNFEKAMNIYSDLISVSGNNCYIFVAAGKVKKNDTYVIGYIYSSPIVKVAS